MPWFRFRKKDDSDSTAADAATRTATRPEPPVARSAARGAADTTDSARPQPTRSRSRQPEPGRSESGQAESGQSESGQSESGQSQAAKSRRRGSRGGRGRKKSPSAEAAGAAKAEAEGATESRQSESRQSESRQSESRQGERRQSERKQSERKQPERKQLSQRQERRREQGRRRQPQRRAPLPAAKRELLVSVDVGEQRVAVLEDGQVAEVYLERPERRSIAGNIYLGTVDNVLPGMEAAFVEIGLEKNGFLYVDEIVGPELERGHGRKIQDLISRGQTLLVQAVKDPMKTKGARLTTQISLPGRFVVFVPQGEGLGVSRRLEDEERTRLKEILRKLEVKEGGIIVRTAAEGASEEDIERDLVFLQRLWRSIQAKAKAATAPELIYQEAELPLRVTRDLFTGDFEKAYVDNEQAYKRIVGYLKKTSPHMVERVVRYKEAASLMESFGVEQEIKSTLNRRVDLPSGGYLVFDYAEAFTVIDVNTGRFVGSRGKNASGRLEDTITKNNLEAVKEVVRQLRLRDIGGIIVIDFIDMANPKNRAAVEEALRTELERDRTKTYVVEISPLGLVEMTRQNVTDGPRELMTRKCPTCGGDGIVYSEASAAIDVERRLRALAAGSRSQAFRIELADSIASALVGPGARRLIELEALTRKRFFLEGKPATHADHFVVLAEGKLADIAPKAPIEEGTETMLQLVEVDRHDAAAAVGKLDGLDVVVAEAATLVGKRLKVRVERVLDGTAYATLMRKAKKAPEPLTAEAEAEKPTRKPPARKSAQTSEEAAAEGAVAGEAEEAPGEAELAAEGEPEAEEPAEDEAADAEGAPAKKKTRRGSRGGRKRHKKPAAEGGADEEQEPGPADEAAEAAEAARPVTIHLPGEELGRKGGARGGATEPAATGPAPAEPAPAEPGAEGEPHAEDEPGIEGVDGAEEKPKRKTRRGSRGGRRRRKGAASTNGAEPADDLSADEEEAEPVAVEPVAANGSGPEEAEPAEAPPEPEQPGEWGYVPMSEWLDEIDSGR